jgi:hypothetical protein
MPHAFLSYHHDLITTHRGTQENLRVVGVPVKIWTRPHLKKSQNIFISTSLLSEDLFMLSPSVLLGLPCACTCVFLKSCIYFLSPPCEPYVCSIINHLDVTAILSLNRSLADTVIFKQTSESGLRWPKKWQKCPELENGLHGLWQGQWQIFCTWSNRCLLCSLLARE